MGTSQIAGMSDVDYDNLVGYARDAQTQLAQTGTFNGKTEDQNLAAVQQPGNTTNVAYQPTTPIKIPMGPTLPGSNEVVSHTTTPVTTPSNNVPFIQADGTTGYRPATPPSGGPFTQIVPGYSPPVGPPAPSSNPGTNTTTGSSNPTGQMDGSLHLNVNGTQGTDIPVFKGTSFESGSDLAKQLGLDFKQDPKTGEVTIGGTKVMPTSYDKQGNAMVGVRQVANALGYQIGYDDKSKTVTITGENKQPPTDIQPWQAPDTSGMNGQMMPYGTFNGDMNNYYTQAHNQLDAQYQQQKQALLDKQDQDIKNSDESMNRRGIYSSGVAQSVEDDLRTKTTQAVANVLSNQMAAVAKQAQSLYDTAYKQYMDGNNFALKNNEDVVKNMLAVEKQSFTEYIQTHKLSDAETNAANAEFDKQADRIQRMTIAQLPYQYETANNAANNQVKTDIAMLPYQQMTIYQQMTTQEKAQMDQATNYFKQQGINVDYAKLAESIRHNQSTEANAAANTQMNAYKLAGYLPNGQPTFDREKFEQTKSHDADLVDIARTNATNSENKTQIDAIGKELTSINGQINSIYNSYTTDTKQQAANMAMVTSLSGQRDQYINQLKSYTDKGFYNPPSQ